LKITIYKLNYNFPRCEGVLSRPGTDTAWQVESENIIMKYVVSCFEIFKCIHQIQGRSSERGAGRTNIL